MMKLYSARPDTVMVSCFRARPLQMGAEEFIYPPRQIELKPGYSEWEDGHAKNALDLYGISGIVAVEPHEGEEAVTLKARRLRHKFIVSQLMHYRRAVDAQHKAGSPVALPDPALYALSAEFRELDKWVKSKDPVFAAIGALPAETPAETVDNVINQNLAEFGVRAVPQTPPPAGEAFEIPV